ncbi:MAG: hypothetical protein H7246_20405 [Phycisphaerae bacterium]|nr:hypothetical protein [Saprospiraceae bacterium]
MTSPTADNKAAGFKSMMESEVFYTVTPGVDNGNGTTRTLIPHTPGQPLRVTSSIKQHGPNRLPTILDKEGNLLEVEKQSANVQSMVLNGRQKTKVSRVDIDATGKPVFKDHAGKTIENPKAVIAHASNSANIVQEHKASNGKSIFLATSGKVVESEEGQADAYAALMAKNGSLVYYIIMVNDVCAYYFWKSQDLEPFPTTAKERDAISAFAKLKHGLILPDSNALAMEFKTSWVELSSIPVSERNRYITIDAVIPTYSQTDTLWTPNGEKTVKLALLGVHVVGSTAGHPELLWATFEHQRNTPNQSYQYLNSKNVPTTVPQDTGKFWTLSANARDSNYNQKLIHLDDDGNGSMTAGYADSIRASNCLRLNPWGSHPNLSSAASNSEIISINNAVLGFLPGNDIRKNYMLIGTMWGKYPGEGTTSLANSTMETFLQGESCLTCHSSGSHIAGDIDSVPPIPRFEHK